MWHVALSVESTAETKEQLKCIASRGSTPEIAKTSGGKCMTTVFWNHQGIICLENNKKRIIDTHFASLWELLENRVARKTFLTQKYILLRI